MIHPAKRRGWIVSRLFWLSDVQWAAIQPHLPMVHTRNRVTWAIGG